MRKSRFTEEQIIGAPKEHATGFSAAELCHKYGVSDATFYKWRSKFGGMESSDARKLMVLEGENRKLKTLPAGDPKFGLTANRNDGTLGSRSRPMMLDRRKKWCMLLPNCRNQQ